MNERGNVAVVQWNDDEASYERTKDAGWWNKVPDDGDGRWQAPPAARKLRITAPTTQCDKFQKGRLFSLASSRRLLPWKRAAGMKQPRASLILVPWIRPLALLDQTCTVYMARTQPLNLFGDAWLIYTDWKSRSSLSLLCVRSWRGSTGCTKRDPLSWLTNLIY